MIKWLLKLSIIGLMLISCKDLRVDPSQKPISEIDKDKLDGIWLAYIYPDLNSRRPDSLFLKYDKYSGEMKFYHFSFFSDVPEISNKITLSKTIFRENFLVGGSEDYVLIKTEKYCNEYSNEEDLFVAPIKEKWICKENHSCNQEKLQVPNYELTISEAQKYGVSECTKENISVAQEFDVIRLDDVLELRESGCDTCGIATFNRVNYFPFDNFMKSDSTTQTGKIPLSFNLEKNDYDSLFLSAIDYNEEADYFRGSYYENREDSIMPEYLAAYYTYYTGIDSVKSRLIPLEKLLNFYYDYSDSSKVKMMMGN